MKLVPERRRTRPSIVAADARRALVLVDAQEDLEKRLACGVGGEPVAPVRTIVHRNGLVRGLNLLATRSEENSELPWRVVDGSAIQVERVRSERWGLPDGATLCLRSPPEASGSAVFSASGGETGVALHSGEDYAFEGYFARHRCVGSLRIELLGQTGGVITTLAKPIPKASGGGTLETYAKVSFKFHAPPAVAAARVRLSIDANDQASSGREDAFLFFADLSLSAQGESGLRWQPEHLSPAQIEALSRGAALVELALPRTTSPSVSPDIVVTDMLTADESEPVQLPLAFEEAPTFKLSSFDGVTLSGRLSGAARADRLELAIDGIVAARALGKPSDAGEQDIKLRVPDAFLDGGPHVVELREGRGGRSLYLNAVTLRHLTTPWETLLDFSRSPLPLELHPLAGSRYANLAAHLRQWADHETTSADARASFANLARAHTIVADPRAGNSANDRALQLPVDAIPDVSIITCTSDIVAFCRTAAALLLSCNRAAWELVVATDDTPENIARASRRVSGFHIVTAAKGASRGRMLNLAGRHARGAYLTLIGESTEPAVGWLDELQLAFALFANVGIACAKIASPSGRLISAGGVVTPSRLPQPIVSTGNPHHPAVAHARRVDYAPLHGAMIGREVWNRIGGLSEDLIGAFADADLSLKVRSMGLDIVYAPTATLTVNQEPRVASSPDELRAFKRKWPSTRASRRRETDAVDNLLDRDVFGRVLFIDQQTPRGDVDAGSYAALQEMRLFQSLGFTVTFLPLNLTHLGVYTRALQRIGVEVVHAPFAGSIEDFLQVRGEKYDLVYITRYQVARAALPLVRRYCANGKVIFNAADLHFLRELRLGLSQKNAAILRRSVATRDEELDMIRQADLTLSYSDVEHAVIASHNLDRGRVAKAPWVVVPADDVPPFVARSDVAFIGSFGHAPNVEAVTFFAKQVMPLITQSLPGVRFRIYGSQMTAEVAALESDNVVVCGHVDDIASMYADTRVVVAPLFSGAGVKGKVVEAMAHGVPTILSPIAAEGLGVLPGTHYAAAHAVQNWIDGVVSLYTDEMQWRAVSGAARAFVAKEFSRERGSTLLRQALELIDVFPAKVDGAEGGGALCYTSALPPLL